MGDQEWGLLCTPGTTFWSLPPLVGCSDAVASDFRALLFNLFMVSARPFPGLRPSPRPQTCCRPCRPRCPSPGQASLAGSPRRTGDCSVEPCSSWGQAHTQGTGWGVSGGAGFHCLFAPFGVMFYKSFGPRTNMLIALNKLINLVH